LKDDAPDSRRDCVFYQRERRIRSNWLAHPRSMTER